MVESNLSRLRVGLFLPLIERDGGRGQAGWRELSEMARLAEDAGFDSLWIPDHLIFRFPDQSQKAVWEAMSMLAALAAVTSRIELGPLVLCAGWRNPALLAKMADTIDEISGGRLILGLGAGWHEPEFDAFGFPFDHRYGRFAEAIQIIHGLLRHGSVDFEGEYYSARECELRPRGPRPGGPPILFGTTGEKMLRLAARYGDQWNSDWRNDPAELLPLNALVDAACIAEGRDPTTLERTAGVMVDLPGHTGRSGPDWTVKPIGGEVEEMAAALNQYAKHGVTHLQLLPDPNTPETVERLGRVLEAMRRTPVS